MDVAAVGGRGRGASMNTELLLKVKDHILEEPKRLIMSAFVTRKEFSYAGLMHDLDAFKSTKREFAPCDTAACIAGWSVLLTEGMETTTSNLRERAAELLGIEMGKEERLFEVGHWSLDNRKKYREATTPEALAQIAADEIDIYIAENGATSL